MKKKKILLISALMAVTTLLGCNNKPHTVRFDTDGCYEKFETQTVNHGSKATNPGNATPFDDSQVCDGWMNGNTVYNFEDPVTTNLVLTPNFKFQTYNVSFDTTGCSEVYSTQKVAKNKLAKNPGLPTPTDTTKHCVGWLNNDQEFNFDEPITNDIVLKPLLVSDDKWIKLNAQINFKNINIDYPLMEFKYDTDKEVANQKWSIANGFENILSYDENNKCYKILPNTNGGKTYVKLTGQVNGVNCVGVLMVQVASFSKLHFSQIDPILRPSESEVACEDQSISDTVVIPDSYYTVDGGVYNVVEIRDNGFQLCSQIKNVVIPDSIKLIGSRAFLGCTSLQSVNLGNGVTEIGYKAFDNCFGLVKISIPESVQKIGTNAFNNTNLTSVEFKNPNGWSVDNSVPVNNDLLKLTSNAGYLLSYFFSNSEWNRSDDPMLNFTEVHLEKNSKYASSIQLYANQDVIFSSNDEKIAKVNDYGLITPIKQGNTKITAKYLNKEVSCIVKVSSTCSLICSEGYSGNAISLDSQYKATAEHFVIPSQYENKDVTEIGDFSGTSKLSYIYIPDFIESVNDEAFKGSAIKTALFSLTSLCTTIRNSAFESCKNLEYINLPLTATHIGKAAFKECSKLETISLNEGLLAINEEAFMNCSNLSSIIIPSSVKAIKDRAFLGCNNPLLTEIYYYGTINEYKAINKGSDIFADNIKQIVCIDGTLPLN